MKPAKRFLRMPAVLALAGAAGACLAADAMGGLGSAFRPQAAPPPVAVTPGAPDAPAADAAGGLRVVRTGGTRAMAWIDGRLVHVGDVLDGGLRVTQIDRDGVQLVGADGAKQRLSIHPAASKAPPKSRSKGERP